MRRSRSISARFAARVTVALGLLVPFVTAGCEDATGPETDSDAPPRLVFSAQGVEGYGSGVFSVGLDGSSLRQVSEISIAERLAVSPSGDRIALDVFERPEGGGAYSSNIHVVDLTGESRRVTDFATEDRSPSWSPDGSRIAFISYSDGSPIRVMDADGTNVRRIQVAVEGEGRIVVWSDREDRLAYSVIGPFSSGESATYVVEFGGSASTVSVSRRIVDDHARSLDWRPRGEQLSALGLTDPNGNTGVIRLAADGSEVLSLTPTDLGIHRSARWSPDGQRLAYIHQSPDRPPGLFVMDANGRNVTEVPIPGEPFLYSVDWVP